MDKAGINGIVDVYDKCKGEKFNGMVFVKFSSVEKRDGAMKAFKNTKSVFSESRTFMNEDLPIPERTTFSFLHNLKKLLVEWKFENVNFKGDTMKIAGFPVLRVVVDGMVLKPIWLDDTWGQWSELKQDSKYKELIKTANDRLAKPSQNKRKGRPARPDGAGGA